MRYASAHQAIFMQYCVFPKVLVAKQHIRNYFHNSRENPTMQHTLSDGSVAPDIYRHL